jgi:transcriptional regulator with XRE-family HTH domain
MPHTQQTPQRPVIRLRHKGFDAACNRFDLTTDVQRARLLGLDRGTLIRVQSGKARPSHDFIAAVLATLRVRFEDVFEVGA